MKGRVMSKPKALCAKCRKPIKNKRMNVRNYLNHHENNERVAGFEFCEDCIDEFYIWLFPELSESDDADE